MTKRVSLDSRINAIEILIGISHGNRAPKGDQLNMLTDHARRGVQALIWLRDDPEARALMAAQAERARAGGAIA